MFEVEIELGEVIDISCNPSWNLLWVAIIREVRVVNKDLNREMRAGEEMFPVIKTKNEAHKFAVPYIVIALHFRELSRGGTNH
jgi:hypothetical protein